MRHLVLPNSTGAGVLVAEMIAKIEPVSKRSCIVHLKPPPPDIASPGRVKPDEHNAFEITLPAEELRSAIAEMNDGDVYAPWNLEMVGVE